MRKLFSAVALAAVALSVVVSAAGAYSNGFESDTADWSNFGGTIAQRANGYVNPGGYASGIDAADGTHFAGLERGACSTDPRGSGPSLLCTGPFTQWGGYGHVWNGPYTTQVDIYLDAAYAIAHPDVYPDPLTGNTRDGDIAGLSGKGTDFDVPGTRFDFTSAINKSTLDANGNTQHLRDFGFNVSTGTVDDVVDGVACDGFVVNGTTNVQRQGANPNAAASKKCISESGWYTFKHSFSSEAGFLKVVMDITPAGGSTPAASWTITGIDADGTYGCNRYGWFANQEIWGLPIDNASMTGGCAAPTITDGQILPTGTTCQAYNAGANSLGTVQYTAKGGKINSVAPGVFFYYGTISGTEGGEFTITQTDNGSTPFIPVQHGQVILYDENCNVLKWSPDSDANGVVTGTLPSTGSFIISVKYSAAALKGESDPGTVTYTIDGTTVTLAKK